MYGPRSAALWRRLASSVDDEAGAHSRAIELRMQVGSLKRTARNLQRQKKRREEMPVYVKIVAVLVASFSGDNQLGFLCAMNLLTHAKACRLAPESLRRDFVAASLPQWLNELPVRAGYLLALADPDDKHRFLAETLLLESLLMEEVFTQNRKGVVVPLEHLIAMYITFWSHRPQGEKAKEYLRRLAEDEAFGRSWARTFRTRWDCMWQAMRPRAPLPDDVISSRVSNLDTRESLLTRLFMNHVTGWCPA